MATVIIDRPKALATAVKAAFPLVDKTLDQTTTLSKRYAPVRKARPYDRRPTGRLRKSIRKRGPKIQITQVKGTVGSRLPYAASVHQTAKPHTIAARKPNLVFYWVKHDVTFVGKKVNHPGVRPFARTQYLYLPLVLVGRRNGFIVRKSTTELTSFLP